MKILLVDDEEYVLDYLEEIINWPSLGINQVYRATSVDEALDITKHNPISIVVTDIQMPEKSGLDLIKFLHDRNPEIRTILLSGYSEFEYAKKAMQFGTVDYLLKPIMKTEMLDILKKAIEVIETERQVKKELIRAESFMKHGIVRMREHLLLDLLHDKKYTFSEITHQFNTLNLLIEPDHTCVIALIRLNLLDTENTREELEIFSSAILNIAEELFYQQVSLTPTLFSCKDYHNFIVVVLPIGPSNNYESIKDNLDLLRRTVTTILKRNISILLTSPFLFHKGLHSQYIKALNYYFKNIGNTSNILQLMNDDNINQNYTALTKLHGQPAILKLMESNQWEEVINRINEVLEDLNAESSHTHSQLSEIVYYLYSCFSYIAHKTGDPSSDLIGEMTLLESPFQFHSTEQIRKWAQSLITQFNRNINEEITGRSYIIRQIHEFIENHLQEDVTLNTIGEHVYLHPVYLSRLYKKETGESLSSYILRARMDKAILLLITTNKKIADIAKDVGYHKTQYFISLFKDFYQTTPQRYRNQMQETGETD